MLAPVREYFVKDGAVMETWQFDPLWTKKKNTIYEVMRIINGVPLFLKEHIDRLIQSAARAGINQAIDFTKVADSIQALIRANTQEDGNILFCLIAHNGKIHILSWYVAHHYPSPDQYRNGVSVCTMKAIRLRPNAKVWNASLRKKANELIASSAAYEVLLIDKHKNITEGSRSNIFFIRGTSVFTTPRYSVLPGITRQMIIKLCRELEINLSEKEIPVKSLPFYEAVFISGTSPGILPVSMIDQHRFNHSNELIKKLMAAYDQLIKKAATS